MLGTAGAQVAVAQVTVQQPSFETFSGATTVSVPDRGRMSIGGVNRGASGRSTYGPIPSGTNSGRSLQGGGLSAHVRIHDFSEMDRQILDSVPDRNGGSETRLNDRSEHAYQVLRQRHALSRRGPSSSDTAGPPMAATANADAVDLALDGGREAEEAERLFRKGRSADAAGKTEVARIWYRLAEQHGSSAAAAELNRLAGIATRKNRGLAPGG